MKQYWQSMNDREKTMVLAAGLCIILYLFYLLVFSPLLNAVHNKSAQLIEKRDTLHWLEQVRPLAQKGGKSKQSLSNSQLLTLIGKQLKEDKVLNLPYQLQQASNGDIQLSFESVPLNPLLNWLGQLDGQYHLSVKQFNAEKTEVSGIVKLSLQLSGE